MKKICFQCHAATTVRQTFVRLTIALFMLIPTTVMAQWSGTPTKVEPYTSPDGRHGVKFTYGTVKDFQPDRRFLELQGKVKSCLWQDGESTPVLYTFSEHHTLMSATYADDSGNVMENIKRDKRARITEYGSDEPNEMDGEVYKTTITWSSVPDADGYPTTISEPNPEGDVVTQLTYNRSLPGKAAHLTKRTIKATGMNYSGTVTYTNYVFDADGNWTSRKATFNLVCHADGNTPLKYTETQRRTITYWETSTVNVTPTGNGQGGQPSDGTSGSAGNETTDTPTTDDSGNRDTTDTTTTDDSGNDEITNTPTNDDNRAQEDDRTQEDDKHPIVPTPRPDPNDSLPERRGHYVVHHSILEVADTVISLNNADDIQARLEQMGFTCKVSIIDDKDTKCSNDRYTDGSIRICRKKKNKPALKYLYVEMEEPEFAPVIRVLSRLGYTISNQQPTNITGWERQAWEKGNRRVEISKMFLEYSKSWSLSCDFTITE